MATDPVDTILAQWQQERPDLDVSPMGVIGRILRLSKHLEQRLKPTFSEFGLNLGDFDVLATLRRSGEPFQLSPTAMFSTMMVTSGTMTSRLDRLEKAELIRRMPDPNDRRGTLIQLTDKGFDLIEKAIKAHVENEHRMLSGAESLDRETLDRLLRELLLSFEA